MVIVFENLFGRAYEGGANWLETTLLALGTLERPPTCLIWGATEEILPETVKHASHVEALKSSQPDRSQFDRLTDSIKRRISGRSWENPAITKLARARNVDLWIGFSGFQGLGSHRPLIVWYPDFQFRHFPELFESKELHEREQQWNFVASRADAIIAISQAVADDAIASHPQVVDKLCVCGFPPIFTLNNLQQDPDRIRKQYHLPERFFLVCNQFWQHKNHALVLSALKLLRENDLVSPVIAFTGLPHDYRRPQTFASLQTFVNKNGLNEYCRFLGVLPRDEQIALIRAATGVIHPSKFEGRGAIVEEATLLGAQLLCSDLPVHRELHAPGALFFRVDCVEELAELLQHKYQRSNKDTETIIDESHRLARAYGEKFIGMCKRVVESRSD